MSKHWGARDETISASHASAVTPSDVTVFDSSTRGLYIGVAGDVTLTMESGGSITFVGVLAGSILPVRCTQVLSTGTTAASLVALF